MKTVMMNTTDTQDLLTIYRCMVTAREIDLIEQSYTARGEAFFHVSGGGHEGAAVLSAHLTPEDWLHCHYRDKALMLARGLTPEDFFLALFNKDGSHSRGRQMNAHMSSPKHKVLSLVGPVGNSALQAAGVAAVIKDRNDAPLVLCSLGDGTTQEGEVIEAIGQTVRDSLPVLFLIQNNQLAISTVTKGRTFYDTPDGPAESFYGVTITRIDGRHPEQAFDLFGSVVSRIRTSRKPEIIVFEVDRLENHTNADDQRVYRSAEEITRVRATGDPLIHFREYLVQRGVPETELDELSRTIRTDCAETARRVQGSADPSPVFTAKRPLPDRLKPGAREYRGDLSTEKEAGLTMIEALRGVLRHQLETDPRVNLYGEDLEDPKGDVFGVTKSLSRDFPGRVRNSPLSESLILGHSIGEALAGRKPVAFLQFADFLPIAYNQIFAELGSMYWRTDGGWQCPVIVMITCGGYKPGLGPFHASAMESLAAHTPGVDVFMPSTAGDAAGLLNAAFASDRPTLFFYPKSCLNDRENATSRDIESQLVPIGKARFVRKGDDLTFVTYGNTVGLCVRAAEALAEHGVTVDLIDLRSLVPWDNETVTLSAERTGRVVIVHEDNHTAGFGAEVAATLSESLTRPALIRRVTRADTYVPCNFENQLEVLPSYRKILETAVALLDGVITWKPPVEAARGEFLVEAIGSSPSDESITVVQWFVKPGDEISSGAIIAELEADKAAVELNSPVDGRLDEILVQEGLLVKVGTPIARIKTSSDGNREHLKPITRENPGKPLIAQIRPGSPVIPSSVILNGTYRESSTELRTPAEPQTAPGLAGQTSTAAKLPAVNRTADTAGILAIASARGSRVVTNTEIAGMCPEWAADDILRRTGIETRRWVRDGETTSSLGIQAARRVLEKTGLTPSDLDLILCTTGTPEQSTPSTATLIQHGLASGQEISCPAYDINAACSGYLYGLQVAFDYLNSRPDDTVMLVTTEVLSPKLDTADPSTAPIFGDAATATILVGSGDFEKAEIRVLRPVLAARGEPGEILKVPQNKGETISMDGPKVFVTAVRDMIKMLESACREAGVDLPDLHLIVPHQANQRILNAVAQRLKVSQERIFSNIRENGNTSSSTIPLCLETIIGEKKHGMKLGLAAFGGGFTFAGGVLEVI